jgi:hypothetical protein
VTTRVGATGATMAVQASEGGGPTPRMNDTPLLAVTIPGDPVAKERPRVNTRTGR